MTDRPDRGADDRDAGTEPPPPGTGFRLVPHPADLLIEAWGPDKASCLRAAADGLVTSFTAHRDARVVRTVPFSVEPAPDPALLVGLLEEVIFTVEVFDVVPYRIHVEETVDGGIAGDLEVVPVGTVELVGALPKGVSYHGLEVGESEGAWHCRALVDV